MRTPSFFLTDVSTGDPATGVVKLDLYITLKDLVSGDIKDTSALVIEEDVTVPGLYTFSGAVYPEDDEILEYLVAWNSDKALVATVVIPGRDYVAFNPDGTGQYPVTITFEDIASSVPIPGVSMSIWNDAEDVLLIPGLLSDSNGEVSVALDPGTYKVFPYKGGVTFTVMPTSITIVAAPIAVTITGTTFTVSPPSPGTVTVYSYMLTVSGTPLAGAKVDMTLAKAPQKTSTGAYIESYSVSTTTKSTGFFELAGIVGTYVTIEIPEAGYLKTAYLPATTGTLALEDFGV